MSRFSTSVGLGGLLAVMLLIGPRLVSAADSPINWHTDVASALQEARTQGRPIMMFVTAKWCKYCHKMENVTFTNAAITQKVQDRFVSLMIDADEQPELVEKFKIDGFPATLFFGPDGKLCGQAKGYLSPAKAAKWLDKVSPAAE